VERFKLAKNKQLSERCDDLREEDQAVEFVPQAVPVIKAVD
jgi:hypothetical protein